MLKLERDFKELNRFSLNMEQVIEKLYADYYGKDKGFPYNILDYYVNKYDSLYELMYKRKESFVNKTLGSISDNYKKMLDRCNVRSSKEILRGVCLKYSAKIKKDVGSYIPISDDSRELIYSMLFPIIEGLEISDIINLYDYFVEYAAVTKDDPYADNYALGRGDYLEVVYHLQRLFVSFIYIILEKEPQNYKYKYTGSSLTYDEVCELVLKEKPILSMEDLVNRKKKK